MSPCRLITLSGNNLWIEAIILFVTWQWLHLADKMCSGCRYFEILQPETSGSSNKNKPIIPWPDISAHTRTLGECTFLMQFQWIFESPVSATLFIQVTVDVKLLNWFFIVVQNSFSRVIRLHFLNNNYGDENVNLRIMWFVQIYRSCVQS